MRVLVTEPVMPAVEPTSSTQPPPRATRCGQACLVARKTMSSSLRIVDAAVGRGSGIDPGLDAVLVAPSAANSSAAARPCPLAVPVISATLPASRPVMRALHR
jgi:hypothetical protein